jgi:hypothetical protein
MNQPASRRQFLEILFGLTEKQASRRAQWILIFCGLTWIILSGLEILIHFYYKDQRSLTIAAMSFLKYIPILIVPYFAARKIAADYLANIFELENAAIAENFISHITFGLGLEKITLDEGGIKGNIKSPILLIGGPGLVQVNLDNVAVSEKRDGEPHVLYSRSDRWKLEGFERIREIGAEAGTPKYAIIDLKDQFIKNLSVSARTKDGILIEAQDIKIIFSVERKRNNGESVNEIFSVSDEAIHALVYKQTVLVGTTKSFQPSAGFPWDSSILPLVLSELENLIMQHSLNEILANIGQKELDQTTEAEQNINALKDELTGQQRAIPLASVAKVPEFHSRSKITAQFFEPEFQNKASELGVQLIWIDIGTWKLPSSIILDKHKEAWNLARENAAKRANITRKKESAKRKEIMQLINEVIFSKFERTPSLNLTDIAEAGRGSFNLRKLMEKKPIEIAKDILRAFRKELLAAQAVFASDEAAYRKNKEIVDAIHVATEEINYHTETHIIK